MDNIILNDVKISCGIVPDHTGFDNVLILDTNTVFMILNQMGVGPAKGFRLVTGKETWDDYIDNDCENYEAVKTYVGLKVRMLFDPPTSSTLMTCLKEAIAECEWRLNFNAELSK